MLYMSYVYLYNDLNDFPSANTVKPTQTHSWRYMLTGICIALESVLLSFIAPYFYSYKLFSDCY